MGVTLCECGCGLPAPIAKMTRREQGQIKGQPLRFISGHNSRVAHPMRTHGMAGTPEYESYQHAKRRCQNPDDDAYAEYGGRGIKFLFTSFEEFFAHVGARPAGTTIDRINNDGNYEVGNVKWSTREEQANNRRQRRFRRKSSGVVGL